MMSTSPSWFDQEKFSRLVKKVGPKPITEVLPSVLGSEPEPRPTEGLASTARISLVSKPGSLMTDSRALPALPRRSGPLPSVKALFPSAPAQQPPPLPGQPKPESPPGAELDKNESTAPSGLLETAPSADRNEEELSEIWHKMSLLNEELARTVLERDQALHDASNLREQVRRSNGADLDKKASPSASPDELIKLTRERDEAVAESQGLRVKVLQAKDASSAASEQVAKLTRERDDAIAETEKLRAQVLQTKEESSTTSEQLAKLTKERDEAAAENEKLRAQVLEAKEAGSASIEQLGKLTRERDDALAELQGVRAELLQAKEALKEKEAAVSAREQEVSVITGERDQARRQYADLRTRYETLKAEQSPKEETVKFRKEWEQQMEDLRQKLQERDGEIAALKANAEATGGGDEKLKQEAASLREQLAKAKDEASVAQRGLALSQKALQQTRDTLREATEGTSLSRHNFDNLKNECAILAQQNTVLQSQVDSLSRDLNAAKTKSTTRLPSR